MRLLLSRILSLILAGRSRVLLSRQELDDLLSEKAQTDKELQFARLSIAMAGGQPDEFKRLVSSSQSQLGQDLFAFVAAGRKREGFFVEFGAGDGISLSNTFLLERELGWSGILVEPLHGYHASIRQNRNAVLDSRCVWRASGETLDLVAAGYLSTIEEFRDADLHASARASRQTTSVETVSLWDLLYQHGAPSAIDFLSIDTEGSEYEILSAFPFGEGYSIQAIACEHNFSPTREAIFELLSGVGYERVMPGLSGHDDWYILA